MKLLLKIILMMILSVSLSACQKENSVKKVEVGIILPMEHLALNEIAAGFSETLQSIYPQPIHISLKNANNDINIQRALIQQMRDENKDLIVSIATGATQMTLAMVKDKPIVSLAADISEQQRQALSACHLAVVHDRIPMDKLIEFIHVAYPQIKTITLIHSTSDKVVPDVKETILAGKKNQIMIKPIMIATLPELSSAAQALPSDTQAILVLKDNLIVSGIGTLVRTAQLRQIPLITSDQGSVKNGASFSLGVHEREIGVAGAQLALAILQGQSPCSLPIVEMTKLTLFVNKNNIGQVELTEVAKKLGYPIEFIGSKRSKGL